MDGVMLLHGPIDTSGLLKQVACDEAGANLLFTGTTRRTTGDVITDWLEYEAYQSLAETELHQLRREAVTTFGLTGCVIVHRLGRVAVGETSVAVAVSAAHRQEAFAAAAWLMEELKRRVPVWKQEVGPAGAAWIHPEPADQSDGAGR